MSNFSKVFSRYLQDTGLAQSQIAEISRLDDSKISRFANGVTPPSSEDLEALCNTILDSGDRFRLLFAFIQDHVPTRFLAQLRVEMNEDRLHDKPPAISLHELPASVRSALEYLFRMRRELPQIDDVLTSFAGTLGWEAETAANPGLKKETMHKIQKIVSKHVAKASYPRSKAE